MLGTTLAGLGAGAAAVAVSTGRDRTHPRRAAAAPATTGLAAVGMLAWPVDMMAGPPAAGVPDQGSSASRGRSWA